jgi:diacylglycerol kinase family enzyme
VVLVIGVVAALAISVIESPLRLVVVIGLVAVVGLAAWYALTRVGLPRLVATVASVAAAAGVIVVIVLAPGIWVLLAVALLVVASLLARYAVSLDVRTLKRSATMGTPVPAARRGVLIMNPKSGGGKAERFHLADECRRRGIEPVVLQAEDDLLTLARDVTARGADVIGMAGGDGSQALVASVAAEQDVSMVVVPAGTRNHLALDLGIDRDDVVGALDAYQEAVERPTDLSEVNGRVFVNNVSLGLYATIIKSPQYRDAKAETTLAALPKMLGPGTTPFDLRFDGPDGEHHDGAHLIQVSNGPYGKTMETMASRPRMDSGRLGVAALVIGDDGDGTRFLRALATGHPDHYAGFQTWQADTFEVSSGGLVSVGLDGETMDLEPPLRLTVRAGVLRVRLAKGAIGQSPAARATGGRQLLSTLWRVAAGRAPSVSDLTGGQALASVSPATSSNPPTTASMEP